MIIIFPKIFIVNSKRAPCLNAFFRMNSNRSPNTTIIAKKINKETILLEYVVALKIRYSGKMTKSITGLNVLHIWLSHMSVIEVDYVMDLTNFSIDFFMSSPFRFMQNC
ncbi:hypothetical protein ACIGHG_13025 [Bacillus sp. NPDC077411]|uniref:hypothetical protein n=1 Tax=Bacillus sp. NPDC077411 TaxID=3363947 RepID=UPI0037C933DB